MALSPGSSARDPASHMEPLVIKTRTVKPFSIPGNQSIPDSKVTILCWTQEF